mgnify:CR=1 FL=1
MAAQLIATTKGDMHLAYEGYLYHYKELTKIMAEPIGYALENIYVEEDLWLKVSLPG